ncbi:MAG: hypothetical protein OCD76_00430 [Reichenbachiella sp.]
MKTTKLIRCALFAVVLMAFGLVGCEEDDIYMIDSPSDLQARIDSIAAAKAGEDTGDTTFIDIATAIVGAEDNSSPWWVDFSDYFSVPANKLLHIEFVNHNGGSENSWNNWNLAVTNEVGDRDGEGYAEYFVLRSDAFGWGGGMAAEGYVYDGALISQNYPIIPASDPEETDWALFRTTMDGAHVTLEVDHSITGNVYLTATALGTNGIELVMTYVQQVSAIDDVVAFLVCDGSYFEMETAYLLPSNVTVVDDVDPVSITIEGAPELVEIGDENFWGDAIATITYADGSSAEADSADISFNVIPDLTTVGEKTVSVAYSKTKQGMYGPAVSTFYTLDVINVVSSLEVTTMPNVTTYSFPGPVAPVMDPTGMVVTATYSDGSTDVIPNGNLQFENPGANGTEDAVISYVGSTSTVTTTVSITNEAGVTNQVGATDFSSGWWTAFANEYTVTAGSPKVLKMNTYSTGANNWNAPLVILRKADLTEYAVLRMDNFGWGDGYASATATNDWNFDELASNINDSYVEITVTNVGDGTANVRYDVTYANGEKHFQLFEGITIDSSDLNCTITIDGCYADITSVE